MALRPYQTRAISDVLERQQAGARRVLVALPTGGGKTVLASDLIRRRVEAGQRVIMLAHRRELIKQAFVKNVRNGIAPSAIGIIMAGVAWKGIDAMAPAPEGLDDEQLWQLWARRRPAAPVQIGSIDTFRNHVPPPADLIIVDEAHRGLAKSYCDVQLAYPAAHHIGLTATPFRADGKGLGDAYDDLVVASTYLDLIGDGFLVRPTCYGAQAEIDLSRVKKRGTDYDEKELAQAVDRAELVGNIVEHWRRHGNDAPTFCFGVNVAHSMHLAERFSAAGIPAAHVDGTTDTAERDDAIAALRSGRVKVLCNCNVFTEGTDVPEVKTIVLARPTLSEGLYMQQAGRGSRPSSCGRPFVLLDHAGCCMRFGLPHWPREYSLRGRKRRSAGDSSQTIEAVKTCPKCFAMVAKTAPSCEGCDHQWSAEEVKKILEEAAGELQEIIDKIPTKEPPKLTELQQKQLAHWDEIVIEWRGLNAERRAHGERLAPGTWVQARWRRVTGKDWPPKGSKVPLLTPEELAYQTTATAPKPPKPAIGTQATIEGFALGATTKRALELEEWGL